METTETTETCPGCLHFLAGRPTIPTPAHDCENVVEMEVYVRAKLIQAIMDRDKPK